MIITVLVTILVLGVLIFVHELGHFAAAKSVDIEVPTFSIGLGPKLVGFRRGETEYVLSWIPLGGYVKMAGMVDEEVTRMLEGGAEGEDGAATREDAASAGPGTAAGNIGAVAGAGTSGGASPRDFDAKPLWARFMVISAGVVMNWLFAVVAFAAVAMGRGVIEPRIVDVSPDSPAAAAGLRTNDLITRVDGVRVREAPHVTTRIARRPGEPIDLVVERDGTGLTFVATPAPVELEDAIAGASPTIGRLGIIVGGETRQVGPVEALSRGWSTTTYWGGAILEFLTELVTGRTSPRELGGPILIGEISGRAARAGFWELLAFMAIISVNLAIFNVLPIPVLDGGHLLFLAVEVLRGGRPLSIRQRLRFTQVGMFLILALMVWAVGNDVLRLVLR